MLLNVLRLINLPVSQINCFRCSKHISFTKETRYFRYPQLVKFIGFKCRGLDAYFTDSLTDPSVCKFVVQTNEG